MLHCKSGDRKAAAQVRDKLSRRWDCILVPMALLSLLPAYNQQFLIRCKRCHTLDTNAAAEALLVLFSVTAFGVDEGSAISCHYSSQ
jgi:hypothetical protein